jgi:hypothetical protein
MSGFQKTLIGLATAVAALTAGAFATGADVSIGKKLSSLVLASGEVNSDVCSRHPDLPQCR